ncbi:MAG: hypothetical protein ACR2IS_16745, partial [Nitrososphaeraceae archaeon]
MTSLQQRQRIRTTSRNSPRNTITIVTITAILILSIGAIPYSPDQLQLAVAQEVWQSTGTLPQPNNNSTVLNVEATNALFEPAVGLTNVFGPEGLFPFTDVFT